MYRTTTVSRRLQRQTEIPATGEQIWTTVPGLRSPWLEDTWCEFGWLNARLNRLFADVHGYRGDEELLARCHTFYPGLEPAGPHFTWAIGRASGVTHLCEGDMLYCPFPGTRYIQDRLTLGPGDKLFVPLSWAQAVTKLVENFAAVEIQCRTNGVPCSTYTYTRIDGQRFPLEYEDVLTLCPPLVREAVLI